MWSLVDSFSSLWQLSVSILRLSPHLSDFSDPMLTSSCLFFSAFFNLFDVQPVSSRFEERVAEERLAWNL